MRLYTRRKLIVLSLGLLLVLLAVPPWLAYRQVHQDKLNRVLIAAIKSNRTQIALHALVSGADPNIREPEAHPLTWWQRMKRLFQKVHRKSPLPQEEEKLPALLLALNPPSAEEENGPADPALIRALLNKGADIHVADRDGDDALKCATMNEDMASLRLLLQAGADVNSENKDGETALLQAVEIDNLAAVKALLAHGANPNARHKSQNTPLIEVATRGYEPIVTLLLQQGANLEAKDEAGRTALLWGAAGAYPAIVQTLLARGADREATDPEGETALLLAVRGWASFNKATAGEANARDTFAVFWGGSIAWRQQEYMRTHRVGYVDDKITRQIILGIRKDYASVVRTLLARGANIKVRDKKGKTVLQYAQGKANTPIRRLLQGAGTKG